MSEYRTPVMFIVAYVCAMSISVISLAAYASGLCSRAVLLCCATWTVLSVIAIHQNRPKRSYVRRLNH